MELKIDQEFKKLIPEMTEEERKGLEYSIQTTGFDPAFPIITWDGFIVDGHNRYAVCKKLDIIPDVIEKDFNKRSDAINWIIDNQLNRRNINDIQRSYLIGKRYKEEKKEVGENQYTVKKEDPLSGVVTVTTPKKTEEKIAEQTQVSPKTVRNAEKFANAVDKVAETVGVSPQEILAEEATQTDIKKVATFEPEKQKQIFQAVENKEVKTVKEAIEKVETEELLAEEAAPDIKTVVKKSTFNPTNDNIEWARWTWNPVTGCKFGCKYCYARDMANRFNANGFEPTFHENRLRNGK